MTNLMLWIPVRLLLCLALTGISELPARELVFGLEGYCPYACSEAVDPSSEFPGYQVDIIRHIAHLQGFSVKIRLHPWSRAKKMLQLGQLDGVLAISEHEIQASDLRTNIYNVFSGCFMTLRENDWQYTGIESLNRIRLGLVQDYGYPPTLVSYIKRHREDESRIDLATTLSPVITNLRKLHKGRFEATFDDTGVLSWSARQLQIQDTVKLAGCLPDETVRGYMVLSGQAPNAQSHLKFINAGYTRLIASGHVQKLLEKYGLRHFEQSP